MSSVIYNYRSTRKHRHKNGNQDRKTHVKCKIHANQAKLAPVKLNNKKRAIKQLYRSEVIQTKQILSNA